MAGTEKTAVALGLFDGVHRGHRRVIELAVSMAGHGLIPSVFTFSSGSLSSKQGRMIRYIYRDDQKTALLSELGVKKIFSEDFNEVKSLSGEEFVREILIKKLNAGFVSCGRDFRFGKNASWGAEELAHLGKKLGFETCIARDVSEGAENISSNRIRELLRQGDIAGANLLLGEEYRIGGTVVHGRQLGRTIDFPTINQPFSPEQLVPRKGVYRSAAIVDGKEYQAITNIGVKPTVDENISPLAETHILGFRGDVYGKNITVKLLGFIRDEQKFPSVEELRKQISLDINMAQRSPSL